MFKGDRLKKIRLEKGLTQQQLADIIGVSKSAICFYEKEKRTPSLESLIDFMHIFAVSADYLLGSDLLIKTITDEAFASCSMTNEEIILINELKKNKMIYNIIFDDPKRGAELIKSKIG